MNHTIQFYTQGTGDVLTEPDNYPDAIKQYLVAEEQLLLHYSRKYKTIVEAGCTSGSYAELAIRLGKEYIGVDVAEHRILHANQKYQHQTGCQFVCDDMCNLEQIMDERSLSARDTLVIFPFNAFGNLLQPHKMLKALKKTGLKFIISTYKTDPETQKMRTMYYLGCGFKKLNCSYTEEGVRFFNDSGLHTMAYNEQWFRQMDEHYRLPLKSIPLGEIGMAYMNF